MAKEKEIDFEKALEKLEGIVSDLETGNVTLDSALKKYEEGVKLARTCQEKLKQAEKKIQVLTQLQDGTLSKEDFLEEGVESSESAPKKSSRVASKKKIENRVNDEDLLI